MDALARARALVENVTPLKTDCGKRCGAACCQADQEGDNGMLLFPGEERYYENADWCRLIPHAQTGSYLLVCGGSCPRENRPLACRVFPLLTLPEGKIKLDIRAWPVCPLMPYGRRGLDEDFVSAVKEASRLLWTDETQKPFLYKLEAMMNEYRQLSQLMEEPKGDRHV